MSRTLKFKGDNVTVAKTITLLTGESGHIRTEKEGKLKNKKSESSLRNISAEAGLQREYMSR